MLTQSGPQLPCAPRPGRGGRGDRRAHRGAAALEARDHLVLDAARGEPDRVRDRDPRARSRERSRRDRADPGGRRLRTCRGRGERGHAAPRGRISSPPTLPRSDGELGAERLRVGEDRPLERLRATLPVKPSVTTTSASPSSRRRLSVLPAEAEGARTQELLRLEHELAPSRPPRRWRAGGPPARATPRISSAKTAPMCANWRSCSGRASALAPASIRTLGPGARRDDDRDRRGGARPAGDGCAAATRRASRPCSPRTRPPRASPSATARTARTRLESGFARTASTGASSMPIASRASTSRRPANRAPPGRRGPARASGAPRSAPRRRSPRAAIPAEGVDRTPPTVMGRAYGAWIRSGSTSRPGTSCSSGRRGGRASGRAAGRADLDPRSLERMLRAALVAPLPLEVLASGRP